MKKYRFKKGVFEVLRCMEEIGKGNGGEIPQFFVDDLELLEDGEEVSLIDGEWVSSKFQKYSKPYFKGWERIPSCILDQLVFEEVET